MVLDADLLRQRRLGKHFGARSPQRLLKLGGGGEALLTVLGEDSLQHRDQRPRQPLGLGTLERGRRLEMLEERGEGRVAHEGSLPREQLVDDDAQGVDVAARVERLATDLLRAHVLGSSHHHADGRDLGDRLALEALGDAEVHEPYDAAAVAHDVGRLEVAVDDPLRMDGL